jgi:hypothetical protein
MYEIPEIVTMFIEDGSAYRYGIPFALPKVQAIGWLDRDHKYTQGIARVEFIDQLWKIIETRSDSFDLHANIIRGVHPCNFCGEDIFRKRHDGKRTMLGMSELWVPVGNSWFAAPTMIVHYVEKYSYLPPSNFIEAVMDVDITATINAQSAFEALCAPLMKELNPF